MSCDEILQGDSKEYESCEFDWNCEKCYKSLCLRIVALADFSLEYGSFRVLAFENKDGKDHIMIIKGNVEDTENASSNRGEKAIDSTMPQNPV
jgi:hypothetical protein